MTELASPLTESERAYRPRVTPNEKVWSRKFPDFGAKSGDVAVRSLQRRYARGGDMSILQVAGGGSAIEAFSNDTTQCVGFSFTVMALSFYEGLGNAACFTKVVTQYTHALPNWRVSYSLL